MKEAHHILPKVKHAIIEKHHSLYDQTDVTIQINQETHQTLHGVINNNDNIRKAYENFKEKEDIFQNSLKEYIIVMIEEQLNELEEQFPKEFKNVMYNYSHNPEFSDLCKLLNLHERSTLKGNRLKK